MPNLPAHAFASSVPTRLVWLDGLRGCAVIAMVLYHFGFDLDHYGWIKQDLNHDLRWQLARALILGSFLFAVGCSHALTAARRSPNAQRWQRLGRLAAAALLVTLGSYLMFPRSAIWFGTLHAITLMSLLLWGLERWHGSNRQLILLAGLMLLLGNGYSHSLFDHPALSWIGLRTHRPITEDYVPLLPWFACCLLGLAYTRRLLQNPGLSGNKHRAAPPLPEAGSSPAIAARPTGLGGLFWLGRHSLLIYLLHQPVLLGLLWLVQHFGFMEIT